MMKKEIKTPHNNKRKSPPKKTKVDVTPKNEVKELFKSWFKKNAIGHIMTKQDVVKNILTKLNAKQNDALANAMDELKDECYIDIKEDGVTLVLTRKV
jgi:predicted flavoprotein YhiN